MTADQTVSRNGCDIADLQTLLWAHELTRVTRRRVRQGIGNLLRLPDSRTALREIADTFRNHEAPLGFLGLCVMGLLLTWHGPRYLVTACLPRRT